MNNVYLRIKPGTVNSTRTAKDPNEVKSRCVYIYIYIYIYIRQRNNILWYNPPFSKNVNTNIGHRFLTLVDKHFPKENKLRKIFNRNTIKISYSCMNNTKQIIDNHNKRILNASKHTDKSTDNSVDNKSCNCRQKNSALLTETAFKSMVMNILIIKIPWRDHETGLSGWKCSFFPYIFFSWYTPFDRASQKMIYYLVTFYLNNTKHFIFLAFVTWNS